MLASKFRLKKKDSIPRILKKGRKLINSFLVIYYLKNNLTHHRFTVTTSLKLIPKAVLRNHLRRQFYEIIRLNLKRIPLPCRDFVLIPRKRILKSPYQEMEKIFLDLLLNF